MSIQQERDWNWSWKVRYRQLVKLALLLPFLDLDLTESTHIWESAWRIPPSQIEIGKDLDKEPKWKVDYFVFIDSKNIYCAPTRTGTGPDTGTTVEHRTDEFLFSWTLIPYIVSFYSEVAFFFSCVNFTFCLFCFCFLYAFKYIHDT